MNGSGASRLGQVTEEIDKLNKSVEVLQSMFSDLEARLDLVVLSAPVEPPTEAPDKNPQPKVKLAEAICTIRNRISSITSRGRVLCSMIEL